MFPVVVSRENRGNDVGASVFTRVCTYANLSICISHYLY